MAAKYWIKLVWSGTAKWFKFTRNETTKTCDRQAMFCPATWPYLLKNICDEKIVQNQIKTAKFRHLRTHIHIHTYRRQTQTVFGNMSRITIMLVALLSSNLLGFRRYRSLLLLLLILFVWTWSDLNLGFPFGEEQTTLTCAMTTDDMGVIIQGALSVCLKIIGGYIEIKLI